MIEESTMISLGKLTKLFPTKLSFAVFVAYMALFVNQGKSSQLKF